MRLNSVYLQQNLKTHMSEEEILTLFPYEWVVKDKYTDDDKVAIHVWSLDKDSTPYLLRIEDFPVLCYLELPLVVQGEYREWKLHMAKKVMNYLNFRLGDHATIGYTFRYMKKTYYYKGEMAYPMIVLKFKSLDAMRHCKNIVNYPLNIKSYGRIKCNIWESEIPIVRKLLTNQRMSYSQWFTVRAAPVESDLQISSLKKEYIGKWRTMNPIPTEICDNWRIYPRILAFDIECYSDNKKVFPDAWCAKHVAYMISCIFQSYNQLETRQRYAIILGPCAEIPEEKLSDTNIIHVNSEEELVGAFAHLINQKDPEVITGYNIFSFDYKYLHIRLIQQLYEWPSMGRITGEKAIMKDQEWSSGAYGHQIIYDLKMDGRINVDLLPIIRRDYKLLKYNLDFVAEHFIGANKHDIKASDMFWIYEELQQSEEDFKEMCGEKVHPEIQAVVNELEKLFAPCLWKTKTEVFGLYNYLDKLLNIDYQKYRRGWTEYDSIRDFSYLDLESIFKLLEEKESILESHHIQNSALLRYVMAMALMTFVLMYCIQDSELVLDLIERLNVFLGLIQMSNVTGVSIVELFTRGQQLRCMSLLYDIAAKQGFVIDSAGKPGYKYTGGFVYPPIQGLHDNVMCWDFSSLYPTIIMAYNIDYTTLVHPSIEDQVPDEICNIIEFDQEEEEVVLAPPSSIEGEGEGEGEGEKGDEEELEEPETRVVTKHYRFKYLNADKTGKKGLLPQLERTLVDARSAVRTLLKTEKDPIMRVVYHQRQLAIKVVCNSFYGFLGVQRGGKMPLIEGAMSITARARQSILKVSSYIEEKHGGKVVYGDSVTGDTPIIIRDADLNISIIPIHELHQGKWVVEDGKDYGEKMDGIEVWSDKGFTPIKYVMRHKTKKRIYRITTHTGVVKVTQDHSLLDEFARVIKPSQVKCGNKLLASPLPTLKESENNISEAWAWGLFYGDGSCGFYECPSGKKHSWAINNQNIQLLLKAQKLLEIANPNNTFKILDTMKSSNVYKLVAGGDVVSIVKKWRKLFYDTSTRHKVVPNILWSTSKRTREDFYQGYYAADGDKDKKGCKRFCNKGQIGSAGLFLLARSLGYKVSCNTRSDKMDIYRLTLTKGYQRKHPGIIKKIEDLGVVDDYVYDLETGNHHFSAGVGELVVHNTDSVMADLGIEDPIEAVKKGKELEKELSDLFPDPMKMELEKVMRIFNLKKKRYIYAMVDEETGELKLDLKDLIYKGIELARRDRPKWLRDVQAEVIQKIIRLKPFEESLDVIIRRIDQLLAKEIPIEDLVTVKGLSATYKNKSFHMAVFAEELRKLGKPALPGSRLEYLVIKDENARLLGQRQRLPETYLERLDTEEEEEIDYMYYIEKILMNPISQLITIAYKNIIERLHEIKFRPTNRHKFVGFEEPILLIYRMIKYGKDHHQLQGAVKAALSPPKLNIIAIDT